MIVRGGEREKEGSEGGMFCFVLGVGVVVGVRVYEREKESVMF